KIMNDTKHSLVGLLIPLILLSGAASATENISKETLIQLSQSDYETVIDETLAALYPQYANSSEAKSLTTFRYLERMYTLDPKSGEIIVAISEGREGTRFDSLWGNKEKRQADGAIETIESLVIKPSDLDVLKTVLFDAYYDRATAEFILANRSVDEARIQWIE
ncbi:hypothetical protein AB4369_26545, partial [Vibrio sp. 10N.261.49.A5]